MKRLPPVGGRRIIGISETSEKTHKGVKNAPRGRSTLRRGSDRRNSVVTRIVAFIVGVLTAQELITACVRLLVRLLDSLATKGS